MNRKYRSGQADNIICGFDNQKSPFPFFAVFSGTAQNFEK